LNGYSLFDAHPLGSSSSGGPSTYRGGVRGDREVSKHIGSSFDDFLKEDGSYEEAHSIAIKRTLAWQIAQAMKEQHTSFEPLTD
jgi:hypothetical protein